MSIGTPSLFDAATSSQLQSSLAAVQASFDDTNGSLAVNRAASDTVKADLEGTILRNNYYLALGAAGAVLQHLEQV
jgi:hypothetical protein